RDHRERQVAALREVDVVVRAALGRDRVPVAVFVAVAAGGHHEGAECEEDDDQSLHERDTFSLLGAGFDRNSMLLATSSAGPPFAGGSDPVMATSCSSTSQRS